MGLKEFSVLFTIIYFIFSGDEYGWKQVHGDVFRPASQPLLFSALIGTGQQISFVVLIVICFAIIGDLYTE